jgi:hypothetical protein
MGFGPILGLFYACFGLILSGFGQIFATFWDILVQILRSKIQNPKVSN